MGGQQNQNIRVYVRSRPLNSTEKSQGSTSVLSTSDHTVTVKERPQDKFTKTFTFDRVFGEKSRQVDVYRTVVKPLLEEVLLGYNCTVFAYGQTGTGKTFTMEGESSGDNTHWDQDPGMGIIPRTLSQLFDELRMQGCEFTVRVSFLELYNEELFDLLSPASDTSKLRLYEDSARKGSCIIQGLEEAIVHNKNEVYKILQQGSAKRQTAATLMNAHSSRSHTVFSVTVHIKENNVEGEELLKIGKLNLVDLAGSENIGRSGAIERRAREAGNINMSLLTLGRVITSLVECAPHVPYRESKLTRLLQDSLGGRTKTSIIATVSPATCNLEETLSTLDYAHRAKKITNRPEVNQKLTKKTLLKEYTGEIERLRRDLTATREQNGVFLAAENYQQMLGQIEEQTKEIVDKVGHIRALQEQLEGLQGMFSELKEEADGHKAALQQTREVLTDVRLCLERTETECEEQQQLVSRHVDTEQKLSAQAGQLLNTVTRAAGDLQAVHGALERKRQVEAENQSALEAFRSEYQAAAAGVLEQLERTGAEQLQFCRTEEQQLVQLVDRRRDEVAAVSRRLAQLLGASTEQQRDLEAQLTAEAGAAHAWIAALLEQLGSWRDQQASSQQLLRQQIEEAFRVQRDGVEQLLVGERQQDAVVSKLVAENARDMRALVESMRQHAEQLQLQERQHSERQQSMLEESQRAQLPNQQNLTALTTGIGEDVSAMSRQLAALTERVSQLSAAHTSIIGSHQLQLSGLQQLVEEQQTAVAEPLRQLVSCAGQGATFLDQHQSALDTTVQRRADTRDQQWSDSGDRLCAVQSSVSAAVAETQAVWDEAAVGCEQALRLHSDQQTAALQQSQRRVQTAAAGLQQAVADTDATHTQLGQQLCKDLEHQRAAVADHCQQSQRAGDQLLATARHSQQLVQRLVDSELQEDRPSGNTPARRQFSYPRYLAATSPHQRILDRHRAARRTAADLAAAVPSPLADLEEAAGEAATPLSRSNSAPDLSADPLTNEGPGSAASSRANSFVSDASDVSSAATTATDVENQAPEDRKQKSGFRVPVSKVRSKRIIRGDKLISTASAAAPPKRTALQQQNTK